MTSLDENCQPTIDWFRSTCTDVKKLLEKEDSAKPKEFVIEVSTWFASLVVMYILASTLMESRDELATLKEQATSAGLSIRARLVELRGRLPQDAIERTSVDESIALIDGAIATWT